MVCLETTFVIDILRGRPEAKELLEELLAEDEFLTVSAPTVMEIVTGAGLGRSASELDAVQKFLSSVAVLPLDQESAISAGETNAHLILSGDTVPPMDIMIAAIAKHHGQTLVTKNVKHFSRMPGVDVVSY